MTIELTKAIAKAEGRRREIFREKPSRNAANRHNQQRRQHHMGIMASIYEPKDIGNCSNGGISSRATKVCVVNAEGPFEPSEDMPGVEIIRHPAGPRFGPIAVPVDRPEGRFGPMAGGCIIDSSDVRFTELLEELGGTSDGGVSLHDRYETPEENDRYSR